MKTQHHPRTRPAWGAFFDEIPAAATLTFGARAIYTNKFVMAKRPRQRDRHIIKIEVLHDRREMVGGTDAERKAFAVWLTRALKLIEKSLDAGNIGTNSDLTVKLVCNGYTIIAGPLASHGYLYIIAWKVPS